MADAVRPIVLLLILLLGGCAQQPTARPPTPGDATAEHLRAIAPPAAAEVADLRAQELAAQLAAARAAASQDLAEAQRQGALAAELARLRADAEERERDQRAELDKRIAAAEDDGRRQRAEQAAESEAQRRRDEIADWRTTCRWIALGCLVASALVAGGGLWANAIAAALWPAAGLVGIGLVVQAWGEALAWLAWLLPLAGALTVAVVAVLVIRRRTAVAVETAHLGDAIETGTDVLGRGIVEAKKAVKRAQERAGIFHRIERLRGKS